MKLSDYNSQLVAAFLEEVWNGGRLDRIDDFIHPEYVDHNLPEGHSNGREGLERWLRNTSAAFEHRTLVESIVADESRVAARISFQVRHIGNWRGIAASLRSATVKGFRHFEIRDGMIAGQWALIDGDGLQSALTDDAHACALPTLAK